MNFELRKIFKKKLFEPPFFGCRYRLDKLAYFIINISLDYRLGFDALIIITQADKKKQILFGS